MNEWMNKRSPSQGVCCAMLSLFSRVWLFVTLWTVTHQAPLSMGFSRQECWSEFPCPPSGYIPDPGIQPESLISLALAGGFFTATPPGKPHFGMLVAQLCLTSQNPMDCSPPGSSVHGISQIKVLEWVAIPFSRVSSWPRDGTWVSYIVGRFLTIWATREIHSDAYIF